MIRFIDFCIILVLSMASIAVLAQEKFIRFDEDVGYCSHSYHIIQDSYGFLWSATLTGLVKTDGYEYKKFTSDRADSTTIATNFSAYLFEDRYQNIWVNSHQYGLSIYDRSADNFIRIKAGGRQGLQSDKITDIISIRDSIVFICGNAGLEKVIINDESYKNISFELFRYDDDKKVQQVSNHHIWSAEILSQERLFLSSTSGFALFDIDNSKFIYSDTEKTIPTGVGFASSLDTERNNLWVAETNSPLIKINLKSGERTKYDQCVIQNGEHYMLIDDDDRLWIKETGFGIQVIDLKTEKIQSYDATEDSEINHKDRWAKRLTKTKDGTLFLSSNSDSRFQHIPSIKRAIESTKIINSKDNNTSSIYEDEDYLLVSFYSNGVFLKNKLTNEEDHFTTANSGIQDDLILNVQRLRNGDFLLLGKPHAYLLDPKTKKITIISTSFFYRNGIELSNGDLWLFSEAYAIDRLRKNKEGKYQKVEFESELSQHINYRKAIENEDGTIWIITASAGLILTNINGDILKIFSTDHSKPNSIISNTSECLYKDSKGRIWVGSLEGLSLLQQGENHFINFTTRDGLDDTSISDIIEDNTGQIWVSSFDGLYKYDEENKRLRRVSQSHLLNTTFGQRGFFKFHSLIYAAGTEGVDIIRAVKKSTNSTPPIVQLTNIYKEDEIYYQERNLETKKNLIIAPDDKDVSLEFAALHFGTPFSKTYQYRTSAKQEDWIDFSNNRKIPMSRFPYGRHSIEVRASNADGVWSDPKKYTFHLQAPWHKTYWFYILSSLGVCFFFYGLFRWKLYQMEKAKKKQMETERHITELEMRALKAQMNPHFIFNSLNSIKGLIINGNEKEAALYISKFSKLVRNVLDNSTYKTISLKKELEVLEIYIKLEQQRFRDDFTYSIDIADDIDAENTLIPPVTLQPFVENAIWHGFKNNPRKNHLAIVAEVKEEELWITIKDNGVGRKQARTPSKKISHGIAITRKRILNFSNDTDDSRLTYHDLHDDDGNPTGTLVSLTLPIKYDDND